VESESKTVAGKLIDVGHIPLAVEDFSQTGCLLAERLACQLVSALFDPSAPTAPEDTRDQLGVFVLEVAKELDREVNRRRSSQQRLTQFCAVVKICRPAGSSPLLTRRDESTGSESGQVLANRAWSNPQ
jgi:hypothetical protein